MVVTTSQDDDLIIFNEELSEDTSSTSGSTGGSAQGEDNHTEIENQLIVEPPSDDIITFDTGEIVEDIKKPEPEVPEISEITLDLTPTDEVTQEELIDIQDRHETPSFSDIGIDLEKLGDSEANNLKNIKIEDTTNQIDLESTLGNVEETEGTQKVEDMASIQSIEDLTADFSDSSIDEDTLNGILDATILKIDTRKEKISIDIGQIRETIAAEEIKITKLKQEMSEVKGKISEDEKKIHSLEEERSHVIKTRDGIEKMKQKS